MFIYIFDEDVRRANFWHGERTFAFEACYLHTPAAMSHPHTGVLLGVCDFLQFFSNPCLGALSDIWGRRPTLLFSLASACLCSLSMALSPTLGTLAAVAVVTGLTNAVLTSASSMLMDSSGGSVADSELAARATRASSSISAELEGDDGDIALGGVGGDHAPSSVPAAAATEAAVTPTPRTPHTTPVAVHTRSANAEGEDEESGRGGNSARRRTSKLSASFGVLGAAVGLAFVAGPAVGALLSKV